MREAALDELSRSSGLSQEAIGERLEFLGFSPHDVASLVELAPHLAPRRPEIVDGLYRHLCRFGEPASLLTSEALVERLKKAQVRYLDELTAGSYGRDYVHRRLRIGEVHHLVGLKPRWYLGAYSFYLVHHAEEIVGSRDAGAAARAFTALLKIVFFDAGLALHAYGLSEDRSTVEKVAGSSPASAAPRPVGEAAPRRRTLPKAVAYTEGDISVRCSFLELGAPDFAELKRAGERIVPLLPEIVDGFYDKLLERPALARLVSEPGVLERLRALQIDYWERFFRDDPDRAYAASRLRIGRMHQKIKLDSPWYLAAFGVFLARFVEVLLEDDPAPLAALRALIKKTFFDVSFVLDAYLDARREALLNDLGYAAPLLSQISTGIAVLGDDMEVVSANRAFLKLFQLDSELLYGTHIRAAVSTEEVEVWVRQILDGGDDTVEALVRVGGHDRPRMLRVSVLGLPVVEDYRGRVALVVDDVSEIIRWGQETELSKDRHRALIEDIDGVVWEADTRTWAMNLVSHQIEPLTGLAEDYWLETQGVWLEHMPAEDRDVWVRSCRDLKEEGGVLDVEHRLRHRDGSLVWVASKARLVRDRQGRTVLRGLTVDVSERVRTRQMIEEHCEALELARSKAETASRAKDDFIAAMSHEIRTPMNAILGMASVLASSPLDADQSRCVGTLRAAGDVLHVILDDLLDLSLLEQDLLEIHSSRVEIHPFVQNIFGIFEPRLGKKGLNARLELDESLPPFVETDPVRVRQVVVRLLSNAVKFTDSGDVSLSVGRRGQGRAFELVVVVADTGIGIAAADVERILERFERVDLHRQGAGLGLAISNKLTRLMGGGLEVRSALGTGTTVTVTLPVVEPRPGEEVPEVRPLGVRVLIVEDETVSQMVATRIVETLDGEATVVGSGEEALELLASETFPVILMDIRLPGIDGIETTRRIRQLNGAGDPWIVGVSAHTREEDRLVCLEAGMDDFLPKPLTLEALERAFSRRRRAPRGGS